MAICVAAGYDALRIGGEILESAQPCSRPAG